jgi:hypothetical protein
MRLLHGIMHKSISFISFTIVNPSHLILSIRPQGVHDLCGELDPPVKGVIKGHNTRGNVSNSR